MGTFTSYAMMHKFMEKAKNKSVGRPLPASMRMKLLDDGTSIAVTYGKSQQLFVVTPDNVLTFTASIRQLAFRAAQMRKVIQFHPHRIRTDRYRIVPTHRTQHWPVQTDGCPDYYQGIQFNLTTGECLNRKDFVSPEVIPEARKVWLAALRNFKRAVTVRVKLGVVDGFVNEAKAQGRGLSLPWQDFSSEESLSWLTQEIMSGNVTTDLLKQITYNAYRTHNSWREEFTTKAVIKYVNSLIGHNRTALRMRFNVFK